MEGKIDRNIPSPPKPQEPYYEITGGTPLNGDVTLNGSKNASLPILAASLLTKEPVILTNLPRITDIKKMLSCLTAVGKKIKYIDPHSIQINHQDINELIIPDEARGIRGSILLLGPLLAHYSKVTLPLPGGCAIGKRPIDLHISALQALGVDIVEQNDTLICTRRFNRLQGNTIKFSIKTVTGTENVIMAAVLAQGTTLIQNAAVEPEIDDLIRFLNMLGANIKGTGTETIEITGVESLLRCSNYPIMSDRIEAGTYLIAAAITGGRVTVRPIDSRNLGSVLIALKSAGASIECNHESITLDMRSANKHSVTIETQPYPGFPTDMQSLFLSLATTLNETSTIKETIFENRFLIAQELQKMGAEINVLDNTASIKGGNRLNGAALKATDLRSGAALVCAALAAKGTSIITKIEYIERGYEALVLKLKELGAQISVVYPEPQVNTGSFRFFDSSVQPSESLPTTLTPVFNPIHIDCHN